MHESPVRVALLARPGDARDQLRRALAELGAELVAEGDPAELDPGEVAGHNPGVVLVSLEPALEDSLARFEDLLAAPGIDVIYDDAEVTRQLDGWDLARWARHLAAKLVGSDLLPPPPGGADHLPELELSLEPGAPPTPAEQMADEKLEDYAAESLDLSEWVPTNPSLAEPQGEPDAVAGADDADPVADTGTDTDLDLNLGDLEQAMGRVDAEAPTLPRHEPDDEESLDFDPSTLDIDLSSLPEEGSRLTSLDDDEALAPDDEPLLADLEISDEPVNFSSFSDEEVAMSEQMDDDVAALAAQLDAYEQQDRPAASPEPDYSDSSLSLADDESPADAPAATPAAATFDSSAFGSLELIPMEDEAGAADADAGPQADAPLAPAASRSRGGLSLADAEATSNNETARGALLVLAGLGGPDAVRQLLAALPPTLKVPVLLYQHLDTGKHDRLVGQLAKASQLPLDLAVEGKLAFPGRVAVLQPGMGVALREENFQFTRVQDLSQVVSALPAGDSTVLVLSGADPEVMPAVLALLSGGGTVLAQDPASCFDAAAAELAIQAGATSAAPADLAQLVVGRWN